jgi:hypothetical protein
VLDDREIRKLALSAGKRTEAAPRPLLRSLSVIVTPVATPNLPLMFVGAFEPRIGALAARRVIARVVRSSCADT